MGNVEEHLATSTSPPAHTWRKRGFSKYMSMRIDHVIAPLDTLSIKGRSFYIVERYEVGGNTFGSDHFPTFFTISPRARTEESQKRERTHDDDCITLHDDEHQAETLSENQAAAAATSLPEMDVKTLISNVIQRWERTSIQGYKASRKFVNSENPSYAVELGELNEINEFFTTMARVVAESDASPAIEAAPPACLATYSLQDHEFLPHNTEKVLPDTRLAMGKQGRICQVLWDTGAFYNIMSRRTANRLGLKINTHAKKPIMLLADRSTASPVGDVHAPIRFGPSTQINVQFFIMEDCPREAMLGSHFMSTVGAILNTKDGTITIAADGQQVDIRYEVATNQTISNVAAMHATACTTVPPRTEMNVEVQFAFTRRDITDEWGLVNDANNHAVTVAKGFTCALKAAHKRNRYHCRVMNASDKAVVIKNDIALATFHPIFQDYDVVPAQEWIGNDSPKSNTGIANESNVEATASAQIPTTEAAEESDIARQWEQHVHLKDLDMAQAESNLTRNQYNRLRRVILKYHQLWDTRPKEPPPDADVCTFSIKGNPRHAAKTRPMNPPERQQLRQLIQGQLEKRIIEPSTSRFSSAVVLIPKKGGGIRFAVDYRALNASIDADSYTLPRVDEALSSLHGNHYFSSLDMKEAFWSVPLDENCRQYTAFQTPDGLMQYRRMPMGLKTASAVFCRYVDRMLGSLKWTNVLAYVDDLLIFGKTTDEHINALEQVFGRLAKYNMTLGANKCVFLANSVGFLGHVVDKQGVRTDEKKSAAIKAIELPNSLKEMQAAMGLMRYYRKFIRNFSKVEAPIRRKMGKPAEWRKKKGKVVYTDDEKHAFYTIREALTKDPILAHPDWAQPFEVHTDASYQGLGATLTQKIEGKERVISFASRCLTKPEVNYSVWELECLAMIWAMRLFRMYLSCTEFTVVTDSKAAAHIMGDTAHKNTGRLLRWSLAVQEFYPFNIKHRKATQHGDADGLSRLAEKATDSPSPDAATEIQPGTILCHAAFFPPLDASAQNAEEFATLQQGDGWCRKMREHACVGETEAQPGRIYVGNTGLLLRRATGRTQDQILVPESLRAFILRRYHGIPVSGHVGRRRTYSQIRNSYFWPGMSKDVGRWVQACLACKRRKTPRPMNAGNPGAVSVATRPWETVSIDIVSAACTSQGGHTKILTAIDLFTRYVIAVPLYRASAKEIGGALFNNLFCKFGKPKRIHSDEGREFVNTALKALFSKWGIIQTSTGGYQPQANPVERFHRFLNSSMTILQKKFGAAWPEYLQAAVFAYNASTNDATGFTPYELIFAGKKPTLLQEMELQSTGDQQETTKDTLEYHQEAGRRLQKAYELVRAQQERMRSANEKRINDRKGPRQAKLPKYEVDDHILFWEPAQPRHMLLPADQENQEEQQSFTAPAKWKDRWSGPHIISKVSPDRTGFRYSFYHKKRGKVITTHVNKICRFMPWSQGILSTSGNIDEKMLYKAGEWVEKGALIVVPLERPYPFGIAKVLNTKTDGTLSLQWYGNKENSIKGSYLPGWTTPTKTSIYYAEEKKKTNHTPYTTSMDDISLNQRDVIMHDFELTKTNKLPAPLLRAIARDPYVWWDPEAKAK